MNNKTIDVNCLSFVRAKKENIGIMLEIIHRCVLEINAADYTQTQVEHFSENRNEFLGVDVHEMEFNTI